MAAEQGYQVPPLLDMDLLYFIGFNDLDLRYGIAQRFPQIGNGDLITDFQLMNVQKVAGTIPASMAP